MPRCPLWPAEDSEHAGDHQCALTLGKERGRQRKGRGKEGRRERKHGARDRKEGREEEIEGERQKGLSVVVHPSPHGN